MIARPTIKLIQQVVAENFGLDWEALSARTTLRRIARPRQIAMYLACEMTDSSTVKVGQLFGGRDHATVIHAKKLIASLVGSDPGVRGVVDAIRKQIMSDLVGAKNG